MKWTQTRIFGVIGCTLVFAVLITWAFASQFSFLFTNRSRENFLASVFFFDRFYLDFLLYLLIAVVLLNGNILLRVAGYIWCFLLVACYVLQLLSVYIGGAYVSILAVDNINHVSLLVNAQNLTAVACVITITALAIYIVEYRFRTQVAIKHILAIVGVLFLLALAVQFHRLWIPANVAEQIEGFYQNPNTRMEHKSPMEAFYNVLFSAREGDLRVLISEDVERALTYDISLNPDQRFPLVQPRIFQSDLPFSDPKPIGAPPNVIVFFAEGLSARTLNVYNDLFPGLTPNLVDFSYSAMVVDNYYNHTYATYRGLLGQLCSIFPARGGLGGWHTHYQDIKQTNYFCLSQLFNEAGYQTIFLDTHRKDQGYVDEMMQGIGFETVLNAEDLTRDFSVGEPLRKDSLSDNQLFTGLIEILRTIQKKELSKPFFISLYNLETHAWQKIADDGMRYSNIDSYILDSIHNYDHAFGRFWQFFKQSALAENTIVVFTSDHAHFADRDFVTLVEKDPGYRPYFVDRIPLIIYDPSRTLPARYDAGIASSIDFTPSMAHFLGLDNQRNPFVGRSIFETNRKGFTAIASADQEHYLITKQGANINKPGNDHSEELEFIGYLVNALRQLEEHNRIWPSVKKGTELKGSE